MRSNPFDREKIFQKAIALRYHPHRDQAPRVTAKGSGKVAEKIIAVARDHGIPLHEGPALVEILSQLDLHQEIPPTLYGVVAEILAFVYSLNQRWRDLRSDLSSR